MWPVENTSIVATGRIRTSRHASARVSREKTWRVYAARSQQTELIGRKKTENNPAPAKVTVPQQD